MTQQFNNNKPQRGFVLFELIVVIALAFIIVSTLFLLTRPDEYLKRQRDNSLAGDTQQIVNAANQFYIHLGRLPWTDDLGLDIPLAGIDWIDARDPAIGICGDTACTTPGEMIESGFLPSFLQKEFITSSEESVHIGKGKNPQDPIYACFIPASREFRDKTGSLYKININTPFPATGVLERCPATTKWEEDNVCYYCASQ